MVTGANPNTSNLLANLEIHSCEGNPVRSFRVQSSRLAEFGGRGMSFKICRSMIWQLGYHRRPIGIIGFTAIVMLLRQTCQPAFLAQSLHQPDGLTTPSTTWQELGAWNRRQPSH
jgi:hypothetical protein